MMADVVPIFIVFPVNILDRLERRPSRDEDQSHGSNSVKPPKAKDVFGMTGTRSNSSEERREGTSAPEEVHLLGRYETFTKAPRRSQWWSESLNLVLWVLCV